LETYL